MTSINYFAILLRQKANLRSLTEADRITGAVPLALAGVMGEGQLKQILSMLPAAATTKSDQKFYHRLDRRRAPVIEFSLPILLTRLQTILNLTGSDEAEQYLRAYFGSARALMHESDTRRLLNLLPPQLAILIND